MKTECPYCKVGNKLYRLKDGRKKCSVCRKYFTPKKGLIRIKKKLLKAVVSEFILEHSTNIMMERVDISKYKLLKVLSVIRECLVKEVPEVFKGTVEVDETYVGGQWKNKRKKAKKDAFDANQASKKGLGTTKQPVFGILCRGGKVWAKLVDDVESKSLIPIIKKQVAQGSTICSDTWRAYTGIAYDGYVHRVVNHSKKQYSDMKGGHINGLEGFWGYLKRKLSARGGIRRSKLELYLGEYLWRYNHRNLPVKQRENSLYVTINDKFWCE